MREIAFTMFLLTFLSKSFAQKSFEGSIKFKTEIFSNDKDFKLTLEKKYGDSLIVTYSKNGNLTREYLNSDYSGNYIQTYDSEKGILFFKHRNTSVIDSTDTKVNSIVKLISKKKIQNQTILKLDCECFEYRGISKYGQNVIINYCFSNTTQKINFKQFDKHIDFFVADFFQESQRPYLKFAIEADEFKIIQTATEIK